MKYSITKKIILLTLSGLLFSPLVSNAMIISVENKSGDIRVGDVVMLDVYISTEGNEEINAVEGVVKIEGDYKIKQLTTAGSVFDLWPNKPSYDSDSSKISFVGGSASSVFGNKLKLFSIVMEIQSEEKISFTPEFVDAYLNNGIGTKISVENITTNVKISNNDRETKDEFQNILFGDKQTPNDFDVLIGRDDDTYDGKYFATFNTTDDESGIERYEVIENDSKTPILTGTTYVLQDQSLKGKLIVKAFDHAGNVKIKEINVQDEISDYRPINWFAIIFVVLIVVVAVFIFKKIRAKNK